MRRFLRWAFGLVVAKLSARVAAVESMANERELMPGEAEAWRRLDHDIVEALLGDQEEKKP